jgi:hypothetical protein
MTTSAVAFYLVLRLRHDPRPQPVFWHARPRLAVLQPLYRELQHLLDEEAHAELAVPSCRGEGPV